MPSRRQSSAMLSSPRSPSRTTRSFSSGEKCRVGPRRMSLIASSAGCFSGPDFCLIFAPCGYDDPEILPTRKPPAVSKALTADTRRGENHRVDRIYISVHIAFWITGRRTKGVLGQWNECRTDRFQLVTQPVSMVATRDV